MERSNLERLLEMAQAGIAGYDQSRPVSVTLVWDMEAYEKGLEDVVTQFEFLPGEESGLNPVQLTALAIYTLPDRRKAEGFSQAKYLQLLGNVLDIYKTISTLSEVHFPQDDQPLRFFQDAFPAMIGNSGYVPASTALQEMARGAILQADFSLDDRELSKIIQNVKNSNVTGDVLQKFDIISGPELHLYTGDEETNKQISEVVWRSVPKLIESKGYRKYVKGKWRLVDAELAKYGHIDGLMEMFKATTEGDIYYILPGRQEELKAYQYRLVMEQKSAERQERRRLQKEAQKERAPVNYVPQSNVTSTTREDDTRVETPERNPINEVLTERIRRLYVFGEYASIQENLMHTPRRSLTGELEFYDISSSYHLVLMPPSRKRSRQKVWDSFHGTTGRYILFLQKNHDLAVDFEEKMRRDISSGESFVEQLRKQNPPKDYVMRFEAKLEELKGYAPGYAPQSQNAGTGLKRFIPFLRR